MTLARRVATVIVKRPKTVFLVFTIITLLIGLQIRNVYMQSDLTSFLPENDPTVQLWNKINHEFQIGSTILVYVQADDIRDPLVLHEIDRVSKKMNIYDLDEGKTDGIFTVSSIAVLIREENAKPWLPGYFGGTGRDEIPNDPTLISSYITRIQSMEGILFLNTYKDAVIIFQVSETADVNTLIDTLHEVVQKEVRYSEMTVTGGAAVQKAMRDQTFQCLFIVFGLAVLFVAVNIYLFHRNVKSFLISFVPLGFSLVLTFGVLGVVHPQLTILTIAAAALLIGLGDDYSVYYSNRFMEEHSAEDMIQRVEFTLSRTGKAVLMCALATMIGFGSLMTSSMPPMIAFGFTCMLGTVFVFLSSTILVPCLCLLLKYERSETNHRWKKFSHIIVDYRKQLFAVGCFFVVLSLLVLPQVKTDVNLYEMAPKGLAEVDALLLYSERFGKGANFNALLVETDSQGLTYPEVIDAMYNLEVQIRAVGASAYSIADELKKVNDILDRSTIVEKIAQFVGIDNIIFDKIAKKGLVNSEYSTTLILVSFPADTSIETLERMVQKINLLASQASIPYNGKVSALAGQDVVTVEVNKQLISSQASSMIVELLLIFACLIIGFGSTIVAGLAMIPVLFVLAWEPGSLVVLGIPLSVVNITVAAIIVSTGIDYGIVITQRLREERVKGVSKIDALKTTMETSGWSIVTASTTTMAALLATFAVNIPMLHQFAIIVIFLYTFAVVAAFCILPAVYASKWFK